MGAKEIAKAVCFSDCDKSPILYNVRKLEQQGVWKVVEWATRWKELAEHGDYSNGVEVFGVDEGKVRTYEYIKNLETEWRGFLKDEGLEVKNDTVR